MEVRDAVEADAGRLAAIADAPSDVMRNLVHDRTVRVAEAEPGDADPNVDTPGGGDHAGGEARSERTDDHELLGFVSFDAREHTVHVTQVDGTREAVEVLLAEPVRFARGEGMNVEVLVPEDEDDVRTAAEAVGFDSAGSGPRFDGRPTTRYRMEP
ncbi:hypothetical protein BRD00_06410 [Halobacteriales archaeon QS_8_69_26]|nr:MAG: hypothetical protein BRD00_06410 [Halobacteriales archaeon QS_8_69_26]